MAARGLQDIPFRIPEKWSAQWYLEHIRDVLTKLDVRNAVEGAGINIEGTPDEVATISSSEDLLDLLEQNFILATSSSFLQNERILEGEPGVVSTTDEGPGGGFVVGIEPGGISNAKLRASSALSVIGRPTDEAGQPFDIESSAADTVLRRVTGSLADELDFGPLTLDMAPAALWTYAKLQDATALSLLGRAGNSDGVLADIVAASDGDVLRRSGTALGFGQITEDAIADGSLLARVGSAETITQTWKFTVGSANQIRLESTTPSIAMFETDAAADNKLWILEANVEEFFILLVNDAGTVSSTALRVERTGTQVDTVRPSNQDNTELQIGAGRDLRLFHDGTNSHIHNDTGNLVLTVGGELDLEEVTTGTVAPSAGAAGALPATPAGYMTTIINGNSRQIPYY